MIPTTLHGRGRGGISDSSYGLSIRRLTPTPSTHTNTHTKRARAPVKLICSLHFNEIRLTAIIYSNPLDEAEIIDYSDIRLLFCLNS